jgi:hypothetical protein
MRRPVVAVAIAGVVVMAAAAAWFVDRSAGTGPLHAAPARLAIEWRGKYRGRMMLPAKINWCPVTRVAVLEAVSGDSGVAIVLYEHDALTGVPHPLISPDMAASAPRPGATAAMRWMRLDNDTALAGFRSLTGVVRLQLIPGKVSGEINARMLALNGADTLVVRGIFRDVPVTTAAVGCA